MAKKELMLDPSANPFNTMAERLHERKSTFPNPIAQVHTVQGVYNIYPDDVNEKSQQNALERAEYLAQTHAAAWDLPVKMRFHYFPNA